MPPIPIKRIISVSSEDDIHKASNLLCPSAGLHWTSAPGSKSKCIAVELEMAKLTRIAQIEVGNLGSAFVEVLVCTSLEEISDYISLLPQSMLMTAEESKRGRNMSRTKIFSLDKLSRAALEKKWRYVKVQCLQPYPTDRPYGLRYIKFFQTSTSSSMFESERTPKASILSSPTLQIRPSYSTPQHVKTEKDYEPFLSPDNNVIMRQSIKVRTPKLPSLSVTSRGDDEAHLNNIVIPKRRKVKDEFLEDSQEFEFAGLENQSRLLKNTLRGDKSLIENNPILNRIAIEKEAKKEKEKEKKEENGGMKYVRRKLLHKELKTVDNEGIDFISTYEENSGNKASRTQTARLFSVMKISKLDDSSEMGEEGMSQRRGRGRTNSGWIRRRGEGKKKKLNITESSPVEFLEVTMKETKQCKLNDFFTSKESDSITEESTLNDDKNIPVQLNDTHKDKIQLSTIDQSTSLVISDDDEQLTGYKSCPICDELIPVYALELHAGICAEQKYDTAQHESCVVYVD